MKFLVPFVLVLSRLWMTEAFVVPKDGPTTPSFSAASRSRAPVGSLAARVPTSRQSTQLLMSSEENEENVETEARAEDGDASSEGVAAPEEEVPEDPEVVAIREEIAQLESTLKEKRRELAYVSDKADEYTKSGYARKVAEMENMRRARSMLASSNKSGAIAGVLASFLPTLDTLGALQTKYGDDDFGKSYNALQSVMRQVFTDLGANEYSVAAGDTVDTARMDVVESEFSEQFPKNAVIQPLMSGWELQGNVIRSAQCVASLGSENVEETPPQQEGDQPAAGKPIDPTEHMQYGEDGTK